MPSASARSDKAVPPPKPKNKDRRGREHLFPDEVRLLRQAAKKTGRYGDRDSLLILMCYRHALRVGEVIRLRWDQISFADKTIYVRRLKNGMQAVHYLEQDELKELDNLKAGAGEAAYIFSSRSNEPLSRRTVHAMIARAGKLAGLDFSVHPHMLRHAKGYQLANRGIDTRAIQGYFGHKNISSTVRYTELAPERFRGFGRGD